MVVRGLDKIALSILGASIVFGSVVLLSTSNHGLNKVEIKNIRKNSVFKPPASFFIRNYVLMASAAVISLGTAYVVAEHSVN